MKCLCPILIPGHSGTVFKTHISPNVYVPCGQCIACRLNYGKLWSIRMMEELKKHDKACFVTLTYDDDHLPDRNLLCKEDLQRFFKRLRKRARVRYFSCGEHGDRFGRSHYHAIIYGLGPDDYDIIQRAWSVRINKYKRHRYVNSFMENGKAYVPLGHIYVGSVTCDSCAYVAKYMTKKLRGKALEEKLQQDPNYQNEFVLMSRRPGIGADLSPAMIQYLKDNGIYWRKGIMSGLPRYWKDKFDIESKVCEAQDYDELKEFLTDFDKNDTLIRERLKFFKRK